MEHDSVVPLLAIPLWKKWNVVWSGLKCFMPKQCIHNCRKKKNTLNRNIRMVVNYIRYIN